MIKYKKEIKAITCISDNLDKIKEILGDYYVGTETTIFGITEQKTVSTNNILDLI